MPQAEHLAATDASVPSVEQTTCCVVGAGPAGAVVALLLARRGVAVTLLELHRDFDRVFRGDTLHPSVQDEYVPHRPSIPSRLGASSRVVLLNFHEFRAFI